MATIEEDIQLLIKIVQKDLDITNHKKFLEEVPRKVKVIDVKIKDMENDLAAAKESIAKLEAEHRHLERDVEAHNEKVNQERAKQRSVKSNKEFKALTTEIDYLMKLIDRDESMILEVLEKIEKKNKEVDEISSKINEEMDSLTGERDRLEKEMKDRESRLSVLEDEKVRILPHLSERIRRLYKRILDVKGDSGVANLVGDVCYGCFSRVPPQMAHEVRNNNEIHTCEVCGRILVYYAIDGDASERISNGQT